MLNKLKTKMFDNNDDDDDDDDDDYCNLRSRAQSTSHLISPDSTTTKPVSPTSSVSSLVPGNSSKTNLSSFLKISSPKTNSPPASDNGLMMTIIRSPSTNSQRTQTNESANATVPNEELSNNNKFFKSKMTAALNHMKYRKIDVFFYHQNYLSIQVGSLKCDQIFVRMNHRFIFLVKYIMAKKVNYE